MLGVLKRRLKPKRATAEKESQNNRKYAHNKSEPIVPVDVARIAPSQRQIHPLFEEKAQLLAYDESTSPKKSTPTPNVKKSPEPIQNSFLYLPKKSQLESPLPHFHSNTSTTPLPAFHPAPNICVEEGRIEFIKSPSEGSNLALLNSPRGSQDKKIKQCSTLSPGQSSVAAVKRAQETQADLEDFESAEEKCDVAKEFLEARIKELERLLESEQKIVQRERLAVTRLQRQLSRRDAIQRDVDRERRLRADTESRLRETVTESERYRATLAGLQREFSKMEDSVRTMLQYKTKCELLNQEKVFLTAAYESRVHQYQNTITKLGQENESLKQQVQLLESTGAEEVPAALLERLRTLETENTLLSKDAEFQRKQYERCLDDIANQVVKAMLSQRGLREEIGSLQRRIKELENQNQALANILVNKFQNKGSMFALPCTDSKNQEGRIENSWFTGSFNTSKGTLMNSTKFGSSEKLHLERLHYSDLGDKNILKSLSSYDSLVVVPLQRPRSLNLHLHASPRALQTVSTIASKRSQHKKSKLNLVTLNKKPTEDEGNESPESGNRDEGYSTMSSDIQGPGEVNELSKRELEDLKEASDETDANGEITSIVVIEDASDPDVFFIPLNFSLTINPRHSYPPSKDYHPFQHIIRSFSDSHLCLKLTTSASISHPLSPSMFLLDFIDKNHPLRKSKATSSLLNKREEENNDDDAQSVADSWCSGVIEGCWWDPEYIQHWLKLDEIRLKRHNIMQLEYDQTEIEEWSMSLSCEDIAKQAEMAILVDQTVNKENQFEKSKSENDNSDSSSLVLTIDEKQKETNWSSDINGKEKFLWQTTSPGGSWSSESSNDSEDCCQSFNGTFNNDCNDELESKRSSIASDNIEESSAVGTDFTTDFYRLVQFESTKSLTSNSSRSNGNWDLSSPTQKQSLFAQNREMALQSVLNFIVEQQRYCHNKEEEDDESHLVSEETACKVQKTCDTTNEYQCNITGYFDQDENEHLDDKCLNQFLESNQSQLNEYNVKLELKQSSNNTPDNLGKQSTNKINKDSIGSNNFVKASACKKDIVINRNKSGFSKRLYQPPDGEKENSTKLPVRNFKSAKSKSISKLENCNKNKDSKKSEVFGDFRSIHKSSSGSQTNSNQTNSLNSGVKQYLSQSLHSSVPTPNTVIVQSKKTKSLNSCQGSPAKSRETGIPISTSKKMENISPAKQGTTCRIPQPRTNPRVKGTKIPVISTKRTEPAVAIKPKHLDLMPSKIGIGDTNIPISTSRRQDPMKSASKTPKTIESPTHKAVVVDNSNFHEKATTKDVIDELNRMIKKGEETTPNNGEGELKPLDLACCCPTGWVHVERDIDFTDPKARANLLDVMLASSGSSGGSGSSSDNNGDDPVEYSHLHRLHRFRRQRKASATREPMGVLRYPLTSIYPTIIGRENFFVRYGDKEKEAVASFDFLEDISTTSVTGCSSSDSLGSNQSSCTKSRNSPDFELPSPEIDINTPVTPQTPITPSDDSDERTGGHVSLSDSCADSYTESLGSLDDPTQNILHP